MNIIVFYIISVFNCEFLLKKKILIVKVYIVYFVILIIFLVYFIFLLGIKFFNILKYFYKIIFKNIICNLFVKDFIFLRKFVCFLWDFLYLFYI